MDAISFKERVRRTAIEQAPKYQEIFVNYEYLLCSAAFIKNIYYIIAAREDNYRHLLGVNTSLPAAAFFQKCLTATLAQTDFDFSKKNRSEKEVKGSVRNKIKALPLFVSMIGKSLIAQEDFSKNNISCAFATTDCAFTAGFVSSDKSRPMTLLGGDEINWDRADTVDLILRRPSGSALFDCVMFGDAAAMQRYMPVIMPFITEELYTAYREKIIAAL